LRVSDIFQQKLNEIQSRVPLKIAKSSTSFSKVLNDVIENSSETAEDFGIFKVQPYTMISSASTSKQWTKKAMTEVQTFREPNFPVPAVPHISLRTKMPAWN